MFIIHDESMNENRKIEKTETKTLVVVLQRKKNF